MPSDHSDESALIGPVARIKDRYTAWADSGITGLTVDTRDPEVLSLMADMADVRPREDVRV